MSQQKQIKDKNIARLEKIAFEVGLRNAVVEERNYIDGRKHTYAVMGNGYLTNKDIRLLREQKFEIVGIYPNGLDDLVIILAEIEA